MTIKYLYSKFFKKIVRGCCVIGSRIDKTAHIDSATEFHNSVLGKYSYVGYDSQVFNTVIGSFCSIGDFFLCGGGYHPTDWASTSSVFYKGSHTGNSNKLGSKEIPPTPVTNIGNDVWVGLRVTIKAGVNIGTGAVIGAGSVVTHDVPPYAIVAGIPAKIIRYRFSDDIINELLELKWWDCTSEQLQTLSPYVDDSRKFIVKLKNLRNKNGKL